MNKKLSLLAASIAAISSPTYALEVEMRGSAGIEARVFFEDAAYPEQERDSVSAALSPEFYYAIPDSADSVSFNLHARVDSADEERSHADIRELSYLKVGDGWEVRAGISKVFWGVTEGQHLVDIINQTDSVENIDGEDKLGQPMVNLTLLKDYGVFDFFVLPGFRERTFAGKDGRLRTQLPVDTNNTSYEASNEDEHVDAAFRWAHSIDIFDIGISHFWGTSRDPVIAVTPTINPLTGTPVIAPNGSLIPSRLSPHYAIIHQTGLDLQASLEGWLLKMELISREGRIQQTATGFDNQRYTALAGGFEYTIVDFMEYGIDLGLIAEWNYDDRQKNASTTFQNDLLLGTRWAMNDAESTEILVGVVQDIDYDTTTLSLEGSTRLTDHLKLTVEGRVFTAVDSEDTLAKQLKDDSFLQAQLDYFF